MPFGKSSSFDNNGITTILNKFFTSLACHLKPQFSCAQEQGIYSGNSTTIASVDDFSFAKIRVELCSLKIKKSSGLKNIPTRFLKTGAEVRAERLTYIYS